MEEQGKGFITVNVRTAGGALPVEGASVTVSTSDGMNSTVVAVMLTDSGGASEIIALPAPPRSDSQSPGNGPVCSYYTIDTGREGYYSAVNTNVPVFDGVTSVQPVFLVPLAGGIPIPPTELTRFSDTGIGNGPEG